MREGTEPRERTLVLVRCGDHLSAASKLKCRSHNAQGNTYRPIHAPHIFVPALLLLCLRIQHLPTYPTPYA